MKPSPLALVPAALVLVALLSGIPGTQAAEPHAAAAVAADLRMAQQAEPLREVAELFVRHAMAGELEATQALLSRAMVERSSAAAIRQALQARILPFFQRGQAMTGSATITGTTDANGQRGHAFYLWLAQRDGSAPRPFTVYVVVEDGRPVIANIVPDRLVAGRHR